MSISFLNSFPSFAPHVVAPSPSAAAPLTPPRLHVSATPLKPSTFAGEVFQARITFKCTPTTTASSSTKASPATVTAAVPPPPVVTQPSSTRALTHQRAAHSMSVVGAGGGSIFPPSSSSTKRFHGGADVAERTGTGQGQAAIAISAGATLGADGSSLPTAYSASTHHLDKHSSENDIPPRRGLIGKGRITSSPLPTAPATTPIGRRPGHSHQRSSSGSDLVNITGVDGKHTGAVMDDEVVDSKGKRRAHRPEMGRAHSISGLPTWSSNQRSSSPSPADADDDSTTPAAADSLPNLSGRNTRPSIPASHPHARKPSYMPPSAFSSSPSASDPFGSGSRSMEDLHGGSGGRGGVRTTSLASISEFQQGSDGSSHYRRPPGHFPGATDSSESDNSGSTSSNNGGEGSAVAASPVRYARAGGVRPPHSMHRPSYSIGLGRPAPGANSSQTSSSPLSGVGALRPSSATSGSSSDPGAAAEGLVITWSYAHLVATLTPSSQYLPPESLLPLRHALLQSSTIGSGTFTTSSNTSSSASSPVIAQQSPATRGSTAGGWFSLPPPPRHSRAPSLTSSLFGLARGVVWGGGGESSLEAERRRKWEASVKEVPVLETLRCVGPVGVTMGREGREETVDFIYTLPLPPTLPPTYQGRALKITYTLVVGVEVELPPLAGGTRERRSRELRVPVRVWGGVEGEQAATRRGYDLMRPVIQTTEEATLERVEGGAAQDGQGKEGKKSREKGEGEDKEEEPAVLKPRPSTQGSFKSYARHLLSTLPILDRSSSSTSLPPALPPPAPSSSSSTPPPNHTDPSSSTAPKTHRHTRSQALSPGSYARALPKVLIEGEQPPFRAHDVAAQTSLGRRRHSFGKQGSGRPPASLRSLGEDDADGSAGGGAQEPSEAVLENLLRSNQKASYDIEKEGQVVAVFTLTKNAYRLGETVSGVMTFNQGDTPRRVLKFSALLQTHELVPASLHPPAGTAPPLKPLIRTHADYHASMTHQISRLPFALDLPGGRSDTIGGGSLSSSFVLRAEADAEAGASTPSNSTVPGGVEWKVRLSFLASCPPKRSRDARVARSTSDRPPSHLVPRRRMIKDDVDEKARKQHTSYQPATSIAPVLPFVQRSAGLKEKEDDEVEDESFDAVGWLEMRTEVIECDVPIVVFPPSRLGLAATAVGTGTEELGGEMEL